ncbi:hypothetical protein PhaeoP72_02628 [Phaeobacter inhibens]|uniref:ABC-three component system middle component 5 n=1 Tax=Phaeobacter inhibens TaxID=221822 RepID=UPI000C9B5D4B|nr:ABC-three component system middle component 5 [Phaeobacter inhibens]AUR04580.1 hypothetical protein PhaeoP72_02628 [Phaeobacter inhibens]
MLNISYSASYDPYHTAFRFLTLLQSRVSENADYDWLKIADFYLCFPHRLSEFRVPREINGMKKRINGLVRALPDVHYAALPDSNVLFDRMSVVQDTALSALSKQEIVRLSVLNNRRYVSLQTSSIPRPLAEDVHMAANNQTELLSILADDFLKIKILGPGGLKDRSGLGEFRYDTV